MLHNRKILYNYGYVVSLWGQFVDLIVSNFMHKDSVSIHMLILPEETESNSSQFACLQQHQHCFLKLKWHGGKKPRKMTQTSDQAT